MENKIKNNNINYMSENKKYKCLTCKKTKKQKRFYITKGLIDYLKCKRCYKEEYEKLVQESISLDNKEI